MACAGASGGVLISNAARKRPQARPAKPAKPAALHDRKQQRAAARGGATPGSSPPAVEPKAPAVKEPPPDLRVAGAAEKLVFYYGRRAGS